MAIDLQSFCGDDQSREYLNHPFSRGDFTYATNAHIMVRVARVKGVDADASPIKNPDAPLEGAETASFWKPQLGDLPRDAHHKCPACDGRGTKHDCPECPCECKVCDGYRIKGGRSSVSIEGVPFALHYVTKMLALPGAEVAHIAAPGRPLLFRFEGGIGSLMPLQKEYGKHLGSIEGPAHVADERAKP